MQFIQVTKLKRQVTIGRDAAFEEVQLRNKFLTEKLEDLEHMMTRRQQASSQVNAETNLNSSFFLDQHTDYIFMPKEG